MSRTMSTLHSSQSATMDSGYPVIMWSINFKYSPGQWCNVFQYLWHIVVSAYEGIVRVVRHVDTNDEVPRGVSTWNVGQKVPWSKSRSSKRKAVVGTAVGSLRAKTVAVRRRQEVPGPHSKRHKGDWGAAHKGAPSVAVLWQPACELVNKGAGSHCETLKNTDTWFRRTNDEQVATARQATVNSRTPQGESFYESASEIMMQQFAVLLAQNNKLLRDELASEIDKRFKQWSEELKVSHEELGHRINDLRLDQERRCESLTRSFSELKLGLSEEIERQAEKFEALHEEQSNKIDQLSVRFEARLDEQVAKCSARIEQHQEVLSRHEEMLCLAKAKVDAIQEVAQGARYEVDAMKEDLGNRISVLERKVAESAERVLDERLRAAIERGNAEHNKEMESLTEKVSVLAEIVENVVRRQKRTINKIVMEAVEEKEDCPRELRRHMGNDDYPCLAMNATIDKEDAKRHFVSVNRFMQFPGDDNQMHPKAWLMQFDNVLPDSWDDTVRINFVMKHIRGEEAERMRNKGCRSYAEFEAEFLKEFWSQTTQACVQRDILMKEDYTDQVHGSPLQYFRGLVKNNRYLDEPFTDSQLIGICIGKLPTGLRREIKIAGRGQTDVKQFQELLRDLGADKGLHVPLQQMYVVPSPKCEKTERNVRGNENERNSNRSGRNNRRWRRNRWRSSRQQGSGNESRGRSPERQGANTEVWRTQTQQPAL